MASKYAIPHLRKSANGHILNMSPPLLMDGKWFMHNTGYTIAKYGMSLCVLGMAAEFKGVVGVNALWPRTIIATQAMNLVGGFEALARHARKPEILSDCSYLILQKDAKHVTGNFFIDEPLLRENGVSDFEPYAVQPGERLVSSIFAPDELMEGLLSKFLLYLGV